MWSPDKERVDEGLMRLAEGLAYLGIAPLEEGEGKLKILFSPKEWMRVSYQEEQDEIILFVELFIAGNLRSYRVLKSHRDMLELPEGDWS